MREGEWDAEKTPNSWSWPDVTDPQPCSSLLRDFHVSRILETSKWASLRFRRYVHNPFQYLRRRFHL